MCSGTCSDGGRPAALPVCRSLNHCNSSGEGRVYKAAAVSRDQEASLHTFRVEMFSYELSHPVANSFLHLVCDDVISSARCECVFLVVTCVGAEQQQLLLCALRSIQQRLDEFLKADGESLQRSPQPLRPEARRRPD